MMGEFVGLLIGGAIGTILTVAVEIVAFWLLVVYQRKKK